MRVLVTREIPRAGIDLLKEHPELELDLRSGAPLPDKELKEAIKGASAIIPVIPDKITDEVLRSAGPSLKVVAHYAVGYDNIDIKAASKLGIYVSNTPGDLTEAVAEHSLALMMAVGRRVVESDRFTREGDYRYWDPMIFLGPKFKGKTLGIVGFGRIGQHFARMAINGLSMKILYNDPRKCEDEEFKNAEFCDLDTLLTNSDVISLHCNLTEDTRHLIGEKEIRKMKPDAIIVNTARGPIINEAILAKALKEGWIEGAGLDVFEREPIVHPDLIQLPNVVLTPHIGSATREARIQMARMAALNVIEVLINKKPPLNLVNKDVLENTQLEEVKSANEINSLV
jgi:glyoxylate reductase